MPSPFPGMDPYLEGTLWPDVHQRLATRISEVLALRIRPRYVARLALKTIREKMSVTDINVMYPDVEIVRRQLREAASATVTTAAVGALTPTITPALTVPLLFTKMRMVTVEIYTVDNNELVSCIEVLSPANKRGDGLRQYLHKRQRLHRAGIHLLEIDLTRRGQRPLFVEDDIALHDLTTAPYLIDLWRAHQSALQVWPVRLDEKLPTVAVPLREPDPDVPLDLAAILATVYDVAAYELSIDYTQAAPPPAFDEQTAVWMHDLLVDNRQPN